MRLASRIIGSVLIACGLGFFVICVYATLSEERGQPAAPVWVGQALFIVVGTVLVLLGRSYLRYRPDAEEQDQPASHATELLIVHRERLKVLAQIGFALSLARAVLSGFGSYWPGRWADWPLLLGVIALYSFGRKMAEPHVSNNSDWQRVPEWIRRGLPAIDSIAFYAYMLLMFAGLWLRGSGSQDSGIYAVAGRTVAWTGASIFYAVEALYFAYGELRVVRDS